VKSNTALLEFQTKYFQYIIKQNVKTPAKNGVRNVFESM